LHPGRFSKVFPDQPPNSGWLEGSRYFGGFGARIPRIFRISRIAFLFFNSSLICSFREIRSYPQNPRTGS
jgi:hypothetical protein